MNGCVDPPPSPPGSDVRVRSVETGSPGPQRYSVCDTRPCKCRYCHTDCPWDHGPVVSSSDPRLDHGHPRIDVLDHGTPSALSPSGSRLSFTSAHLPEGPVSPRSVSVVSRTLPTRVLSSPSLSVLPSRPLSPQGHEWPRTRVTRTGPFSVPPLMSPVTLVGAPAQDPEGPPVQMYGLRQGPGVEWYRLRLLETEGPRVLDGVYRTPVPEVTRVVNVEDLWSFHLDDTGGWDLVEVGPVRVPGRGPETRRGSARRGSTPEVGETCYSPSRFDLVPRVRRKSRD